MLVRCWLLLMTLVFASMNPCHAERVYRLVDYPENQNGHVLDGTIKTTDDAPNDSLLDVAEIVSWQWSISGANTFAASSTDYLNDISTATNVLVSPEAISLPFGLPPYNSSLNLGRDLPLGSRGAYQHAITWSTFSGRDGPWALSIARRQTGDALQGFWSGPVYPTTWGWVIATAVPEPTTAFLILTCAAAYALHRRRFSCG